MITPGRLVKRNEFAMRSPLTLSSCEYSSLGDRLQGLFYYEELALVLAVSRRYARILVYISGERFGWIAEQYVDIVT